MSAPHNNNRHLRWRSGRHQLGRHVRALQELRHAADAHGRGVLQVKHYGIDIMAQVIVPRCTTDSFEKSYHHVLNPNICEGFFTFSSNRSCLFSGSDLMQVASPFVLHNNCRLYSQKQLLLVQRKFRLSTLINPPINDMHLR